MALQQPILPPDPWARVLAAALTAAVVALALVAGNGALLGDRAAHARRVGAAALADGVAQAATESDPSKRDQRLKELEHQRKPAVERVFVLTEGGADEFGIARGTAFTYGEPPKEQAQQVQDHAKTVTAEGARVLKSGEQLQADRMFKLLDGGQLVVAAPLRSSKGSKELSGVGGAILAQMPTHPAPWWLVALAALLAAVLAEGGRRAGMRNRYSDAAIQLVLVLLAWLLLPALPAAPPAGVEVLSADWLVPHTAVALIGSPLAHLWLLAVGLIVALGLGAFTDDHGRVWEALRRDPTPYAYVGPAVLATGLLIFIPFAVGVGLSFVDGEGRFVGVSHYVEVLTSIFDEHSSTHFFRTLAMTTGWTAINVVLHVTFGLALALVLNRPHLKGKAIYRVLLVLPWAVPSYITALTWKWLFNTQFGPINAMLSALGVDKVDWLGNDVWSNFAANLATNVWLGFPFMMVISLGALQSIPSELYEAADIDGATSWQKFRHVTLPLLRPALFPAIILGTIWTFNAFNVIYLVSGGGPDHQTDILITEAYYTFTVLRRTGLAAAYSVLIFAILLGYTLVTNRKTKATEAVNA